MPEDHYPSFDLRGRLADLARSDAGHAILAVGLIDQAICQSFPTSTRECSLGAARSGLNLGYYLIGAVESGGGAYSTTDVCP
jgi:hypothetical protein